MSETQISQAAKIDVLEKTLSRQLDWIKAADSKAQILIAINVAMIGAIVGNAPAPQLIDLTSGAALFLGCIFPAVSLHNCLSVTFPRTVQHDETTLIHCGHLRLSWQNKKKGQVPVSSLLYFGGISRIDKEKFRSEIDKLTQEEYIIDLSEQCHINASIAEEKYRLVKSSSGALYAGLIVWLMCIIYLYVWT